MDQMDQMNNVKKIHKYEVRQFLSKELQVGTSPSVPVMVSFQSKDPFADDECFGLSSRRDAIHIRIQQRAKKKTITTIQGVPKCLDYGKLLKTIKKDFSCNGTIVDHPEYGPVIQVQGDQRQHVADLFKQIGISSIKVHGF